MSPEGIVSSSADLLSATPADLFSSATDADFSDAGETSETPEETSVDEVIEEPVEEPAAEETTEETPEEEPTEEETPEQPAEEKPKDEEELPEGVRRGKDRNGKDGLWLTPQRYETFHGAHKLLQQASDAWGEPITPEGLDLRQRAFEGQERLYSDLLSGDPSAQGSVLQHFLKEGARALKDGEVSSDPIIPLAQSFYSAIQQHPDAYAALRIQAAKDLFQEMYDTAVSARNKPLWDSVGHLAQELGLPFKKSIEFDTYQARQSDPLELANQRIKDLEAKLNGTSANTQAAQFDQWRDTLKQGVKSAVLENAVKPALADVQKAWEKFPDAFNDLVVNRLHSAVKDTILNDQAFLSRIRMLTDQAKRATSAQRRHELAEQIQTAHTNRAKVAVEAHKPKILSEAANLLKERSNQNHERRSAAPARGPKGPSGPVRQTIPANTGRQGGTFSVDAAVQDLARLMG